MRHLVSQARDGRVAKRRPSSTRPSRRRRRRGSSRASGRRARSGEPPGAPGCRRGRASASSKAATGAFSVQAVTVKPGGRGLDVVAVAHPDRLDRAEAAEEPAAAHVTPKRGRTRGPVRCPPGRRGAARSTSSRSTGRGRARRDRRAPRPPAALPCRTRSRDLPTGRFPSERAPRSPAPSRRTEGRPTAPSLRGSAARSPGCTGSRSRGRRPYRRWRSRRRVYGRRSERSGGRAQARRSARAGSRREPATTRPASNAANAASATSSGPTLIPPGRSPPCATRCRETPNTSAASSRRREERPAALRRDRASARRRGPRDHRGAAAETPASAKSSRTPDMR